jgi:prolyl 4-hydroxylase
LHYDFFLYATAEADHIREISEPRMERSGVVSAEEDERQHTKTDISDIRTSYGVFLERGEDDVIKRKHS